MYYQCYYLIIKSGSLSGTSHAAVRSIFSTRVHVLTQPPNRPTTIVDDAKIQQKSDMTKPIPFFLSIIC